MEDRAPMIDQVRDTLRKATKVVDAPRRRTEEAVRRIAERPNIDLLDAPHLAWEFVQRGRQRAEKAKGILDAQVRRRLNEMGLATREEMDALKRRISELESASEKPAAPAEPTHDDPPAPAPAAPAAPAAKPVTRPGATARVSRPTATASAARAASRTRTASPEPGASPSAGPTNAGATNAGATNAGATNAGATNAGGTKPRVAKPRVTTPRAAKPRVTTPESGDGGA